MIARIWTARIDEAQACAYETFARTKSLAMFQRQPGYRGVFMLRQDGTCIVMSLWQDGAAIAALARSETYARTVAEIAGSGFLLEGQTLGTFDIHLVDLPDPRAVTARPPIGQDAGA